MSDFGRSYLAAVAAELHTLETQATKAIAQIDDADLFRQLDPDANSIAVLMRHIAGNARSRFTDFLASDGEKPTRDRDGEFEPPPTATRAALVDEWRAGWRCVFEAVEALRPDDLGRNVTIGGQSRSVVSALEAAVRHYGMHVGQIVLLAKHWRGAAWHTLSIPKHRREAGARDVPKTTAEQPRGAMTSDRKQNEQPEPRSVEAPRRSDEPVPMDRVAEADEESFPASDAPAWTPLHPGSPPERAS